MYPGLGFGNVMGADGAGAYRRPLRAAPHLSRVRTTPFYIGFVVGAADKDEPLLHKRVFFNPSRGWRSDPEAPEQP